MISDFLKSERKRIGVNQEAFAEAAGVSRRAYAEWESGKSTTSPTAMQLLGLSSLGADIQYIVTGERSGNGLSESSVHQAVLDAVDLLSLEKKVDAQQLAKAVVKLCLKSSPASTPAPIAQSIVGGQHIGNNHGIATSGDMVVINPNSGKGKH